MRIYAFIVLAYFLTSSSAAGQPSFSQQTEKLWLEGHKEDVLAIAEQRLKSDPNDIVGLLLKLEYEVTFETIDDLPGTLAAFERVGNGITNVNFTEAWPRAKAAIRVVEGILPHLSKEQIEADRKKGLGSGKPMVFLFLLEAAERDGLTKTKP